MKNYQKFLQETYLLLEYNREKTLERFEEKLKNKLNSDSTAKNLTPVQAIEKFENIDPSNNKQYVLWIVNNYIKTLDLNFEELSKKTNELLMVYDRAKKKNLLSANQKDINKLKFEDLKKIGKDEQILTKLQQEKDRGEFKEIHNSSLARVIVPLNETAACYYGQGTKWCTTSEKNNPFAQYHKKGNLYIVIPKKPKHVGEKYQIHFEKGECMSEVNLPANLYHVIHGHGLEDLFEPQIKDMLIFKDPSRMQKIYENFKKQAYHNFKQEYEELDDKSREFDREFMLRSFFKLFEVGNDTFIEWMRKLNGDDLHPGEILINFSFVKDNENGYTTFFDFMRFQFYDKFHTTSDYEDQMDFEFLDYDVFSSINPRSLGK